MHCVQAIADRSEPASAGRASARPLLLVADRVRTLDPDRPAARAVCCAGGRITWAGDDPDDCPARGARRIDLDGAELQPAFVDAHVHLTVTGLTLAGLDLHACRTVSDCLASVRAIADVVPGRAIWGGGWDDFEWPERRPPSADELARAADGRPVLLMRADGHAAVIDRSTLDSAPLTRCDGVERDAAGRPTGLLRREAAELARRWFRAELPRTQLADARRTVAAHAASLGISSVHEMGGPDPMGDDDFDAWLTGDWPIEVVGYWSEPDLDFVAARGLRQVGGALLLDGTVAGRSAALESAYADGIDAGHLYQDTPELTDFLVTAVRARVQVALHCIGDRAIRQAVEALEAVAEATSSTAVRQTRPRFEHCELVPPGLLPRMAALGVVASVRPSFDAQWGGPGGLYETRLGTDRSAGMNPLRALSDAGVALAFGSDADVTPMDPWLAVGAAQRHHQVKARLDPDTAWRAAVLGGRYAARQDDAGVIRRGQRADLAAFEVGSEPAPACVLTVTRGRVVHGEHADAG